MNLNLVLEVAITLAFLYSLLSIIVSSVTELIMYLLKKRGKFLYWALEEVLKDNLKNKNYASLLLRNPLIDRLRKDQKSLPAYIGGVQFSEALISVLCEEYETGKYKYSDTPNANGTYDLVPVTPLVQDAFSKFKVSVDRMNNSDLKRLLTSFLNGTDNYDKLKINIQNWYNNYMERVNGWYKNHLQRYLFVISLGVAIVLNVDTVRVVKQLSSDKILREQLVTAAEKYVDAEMSHAARTSAKPDSTYKQMLNTIKKMNDSIIGYGFPIGWNMDDGLKRKCRPHKECICTVDSCTKKYPGAFCSKPLKKDPVTERRMQTLLELYCHQKPDSIQHALKRWCCADHKTDSLLQSLSHYSCTVQKRDSVAKALVKLCEASMTHCAAHQQTACSCGAPPQEVVKENWLQMGIGWLLSAIALSFGAPFWFDLLGKLVNLRKSGLKPDNKPTV